jgi:hypothetical protein
VSRTRAGKRAARSEPPSRPAKILPPRALPLLRRAKTPGAPPLPPQAVAVMVVLGAMVLAEELPPSERRDALLDFLAQLRSMLDEPALNAVLASSRAAELAAEKEQERPTPEGDPNN